MSDHNSEIPLNEGWQLNRPQETRGQALTNPSQIHLTPSSRHHHHQYHKIKSSGAQQPICNSI